MTKDHGELDWETYSAAGYVWSEELGKWTGLPGVRSQDKGLSSVGTSVYSEHPSTEILTLSYRLPEWWTHTPGGKRYRWRPGEPLPQPLFDYLAAGGVMEAHKAMFERFIWANVAQPKYGFPPLPFYQLRCSMAKAHVNGYPGKLANLSDVLELPTPKDKDGVRLMKLFSWPRDPTKKDPRTRIRPEDEPAEFEKYQDYCDTDIIAERQASERMEPMTPDELEFWWVDQEINWRGMAIDRPAVRDCIAVLEQALVKYGAEFLTITGLNPTQLEKFKGWLAAYGVYMDKMDDDAIEAVLASPAVAPHPPGRLNPVRRALELRQLVGSASVKKLYALENFASRDDRVRDMIVHHKARTGRPGGADVQPLNLPKDGPELRWCVACANPFKPSHAHCPWCATAVPEGKASKWPAIPKGMPEGTSAPIEAVLEAMATRSLDVVEWYFGDALLCISGCIRGLFVAGPGMDLIASDYSAIEAVVTAMLAGEQWRIDAFRAKKDIYLASASKITGRSLEEYEAYKAETDTHHPDRQKVGKPAELALGFAGWVGAWRVFDTSGSLDDQAVKRLILAWRDASPKIVEMWGGQTRNMPWDDECKIEYYGFEGAFVQAILYPGQVFESHGIKFYMRGDCLKIGLLSVDPRTGEPRELSYRNPRLTPSVRHRGTLSITYMTWNSNPKYGPPGWVAMDTYAGRITENIVQAVAHDIQRFGIKALRMAGYPTVLHVYDENVGEIPKGTGSLEEFERIMSTMPPWAADWPVRAAGGWRGRRYRKD